MTELRARRMTISLPGDLLDEFSGYAQLKDINRSRLIRDALRFYLRELRRRRMAEEAAKIDAKEEVAIAEESVATDRESWPEY